MMKKCDKKDEKLTTELASCRRAAPLRFLHEVFKTAGIFNSF